MEEKENVVTTENEDVNAAEETSEKTFTQAEVDDIVKKRLAKATKNQLSKEEIDAFKKYQDDKKTQQEKYDDLVKEDGKKTTTISNLKMENAVLKAGITDQDEIEFIVYKVGKMEGDFNDNLTEYLKDNPRYAKKQETKATGVETKNNTQKDDGVMAILKSKHPDLFD